MQRHCGTTELGVFGNMTGAESGRRVKSKKGPGPGMPIAMAGGRE